MSVNNEPGVKAAAKPGPRAEAGIFSGPSIEVGLMVLYSSSAGLFPALITHYIPGNAQLGLSIFSTKGTVFRGAEQGDQLNPKEGTWIFRPSDVARHG